METGKSQVVTSPGNMADIQSRHIVLGKVHFVHQQLM
jgi:hypothetical protein